MATLVAQRIRLFPTPNQRQRTTLGNDEYVVEFRWRERTQGWYLSIYDTDEEPIIQGRRLRRSPNIVEPVEELDGVLVVFRIPDYPDYQNADQPVVTYFYVDND